MKRWLVIVLLFIVGYGTIVPCCANDECCMEKASNTKKEVGNCSPFSACASCTGFIQLNQTILLQQPACAKQVHIPRPLYFSLASFGASCWQPPRLV